MKQKLKWIIPLCELAIILAAFLIYTGSYYPADSTAIAALQSDEKVCVEQTAYGWFFDGPSEDNLLIFYPGAKVEETAYAPLLHRLADGGMDVCLVRMPFHLAVFGAKKADGVLPLYDHENRFIGGHSLGGAMAANYAARHSGALTGVILFAAYPTGPLEDSLLLLSIYGSEDGVLNMEKLSEGRSYASAAYSEFVIEGGNHAQFGNYGAQKGDGTAGISAEEQQKQTTDYIMEQNPG